MLIGNTHHAIEPSTSSKVNRVWLDCRNIERSFVRRSCLMRKDQLERRLTFYRWHSLNGWPPFDRFAAARAIVDLPDNPSRKLVRGEFAADVLLRAAGTPDSPTLLSLLRLRDFENRPWLR